jgi:Uncharacterized conserved protein
MTDVAIVQTDRVDRDAGLYLGNRIREQFSGVPDALIVFASPRNDHAALLAALAESAGTKVIVGCSSAGEFTGDGAGEGLTNVTAIRSTGIKFAASVGTDISGNHRVVARQLAEGFRGANSVALPFRAALVLVDALAGQTEELINALTLETGGSYRFFGGGAGDDARFRTTHVFCGTEVFADAAVALEIVSRNPVGIGARHGWTPATAAMRVTAADASHVTSLNVMPAADAFEDHAGSTAQEFDRLNPLPFFLHNVLGVETDSGHKLRVPLGISDDGGVVCAAEVPAGATACIMSTGGRGAALAAAEATRDAMKQVSDGGGVPKAALFFDCVATRLRLGVDFAGELDAVARELGGIPFAGFNSYGQIVRAEGQFSGFHNCTAVVCVLPD